MSEYGPIWDGNGGTLDPQKATQRDLLVALHFKVDYAVRQLGDHERRIRTVEARVARGLGAVGVFVFLGGVIAAVLGTH
jgi:hypothetical protein